MRRPAASEENMAEADANPLIPLNNHAFFAIVAG